MGGQTGTQQQQTQQTTQLPPWVNDASQQNYAFAQDVAAKPLQQYNGQMVADTSPQLQQSWDLASQATGAGKSQFDAATSGFLGALSQNPMSVSAGGPTMQVSNPGNANAVTAGNIGSTDLSSYMNPFTNSVINSSLPIMQQQLGQTLASNAGTAQQQGAFGGSRFGVQQGTAQAQGALGMANMAAGLNSQNFTQAQAAATGDINRQLQAATQNQNSQQTDLARQLQAQQSNQGANAADLQRALTAQTSNQSAAQAKINSDIAASSGLNTTGQDAAQQANNAYTMLNSAGTSEMAQGQNQINAQIAKFNEANNYGTKQLGIMQSALGMSPYGQSTTGQSSTETYTPTDWAALAGAGIGAVGSIFGGKGVGSDMRIKKNIKRVATQKHTGMPIYDFHFKGQPNSAPKTRGPMAQDVAAVMPGAVAPHPTKGYLTVHPTVLGALANPAGHVAAGPLTKLGPAQRTEHRRRVRPPQIRGALG